MFVGVRKNKNMNIKYIQKCSSFLKLPMKRNLHMPKNDLLVPESNPFSFSRDHFNWKDLFLSCCWRGKPRVHLAARWIILPSVYCQIHSSFTFNTRRTFFPSAASRQRKRLPMFPTWGKTVSPLATAYIKNINWTYQPLLKTLTLHSSPTENH